MTKPPQTSGVGWLVGSEVVYIHSGGQVLCDFQDKKIVNLGLLFRWRVWMLVLAFLVHVECSGGGVAMVVAGLCGNVMEVSFVRCTMMVTVVGLKKSEVMRIHIWHSTI